MEPTETTVHGLRQLSAAEITAHHLRELAKDLLQQADLLDVSYGPKPEPRKEKYIFNMRPVRKSNKPGAKK